jgi:hypothetical protein
MRGSKAKKLRAIAYQGTSRKYSNNRLYDTVECPGQHRHGMKLTIIADDERYLYQALKGRRARTDGAYLG